MTDNRRGRGRGRARSPVNPEVEEETVAAGLFDPVGHPTDPQASQDEPPTFNFSNSSSSSIFFSSQSTVRGPATSSRSSRQPLLQNISEFGFFTGRSDDSDFGAGSRQPPEDVILSDDLSNMSLEELTPSSQTRLLPRILLTSVDLTSISDFHILIPNSNQRPRLNIHKDLTKSAKIYFANRDMMITPVTEVFSIRIDNYVISALHPPMVIIPLDIMTQCVSIYQQYNQDWVLVARKRVNEKSHVSIPFKTLTNYLLMNYIESPSKSRTVCALVNLNIRICRDPDIFVHFPDLPVNGPFNFHSKIFYSQMELNNQVIEKPLAAPVIELQPHGVVFNEKAKIKIEILQYQEIINRFGCKLRLFTSVDSFRWTEIHDFVMDDDSTLIFKVRHFSYFKVVWDLLLGSLTNAKLGLSNLIAKQILLRCEATMKMYKNNRFVLDVSVLRAFPNASSTQNVVVVGKSRPKLVKPGIFTVSLESEQFSIDRVDARELEAMVKQIEFVGEDVNVDFSLRFNDDQEDGPFGRVKVTRRLSTRRNDEVVFDLLLQNKGNEYQMNESSGQTNSLMKVLQKVADGLCITDGENWKPLAERLGCTKSEIKTFKDSADPFGSIIESYFTREVTNFVKILYEVSREIKTRDDICDWGSTWSNSSGVSSISDTQKRNYRHLDANEKEQNSGTHHCFSSVKYGSPATNVVSPKNKRSKMQPRFTDSTNDEVGHEPESNYECDLTKLSDAFLWDITKSLKDELWIELGRTLRVSDGDLIDIKRYSCSTRDGYYRTLSIWKERYPEKCTFGNLYKALREVGKKSAADKMIHIKND